ncbi:MAG: MarR family transcriptional regulator [Bacilli bacterium]|nr:MarR family transcriptional regulator [Bacilli bacterium]
MEPKTISALLKTSKNYTDLLRSDVLNYNLNLTEFGVLEALYQKGPLKVNELLEKVLVNNSTVSYTISKLVKDGKIMQKRCTDDKRIIYVSLTSEGETLIKEIAPKHYAYINSIGNSLSKDEEKTLRELLKKLNKGE